MGTADFVIPIPDSEPEGLSHLRLNDLAPTTRDLLQLAIFATLLRLTLFLIVFLHFHYTLHEWANRGDGSSYLAYARALLGDASYMTPYDQRVFPGYPAMIALSHLVGIPFDAAAVALDWICAGLVAAMGAALFRDRRVGWALTCLPLQYVINSTLTMSETPMLALSLGGLLLAARGKSARGGILLGLAGLTRPMACFAVVGQVCRDLAPSPSYAGKRAGVRGDVSSDITPKSFAESRTPGMAPHPNPLP